MGAGQLEKADVRVRAFFGLPVPPAQRAALGAYVAACSAVAPGFRWVPAANLHLTVRFVGMADRELVVAVAQRVAALTPTAFEVELGDVGTFGRGRRARVVWLGLSRGGPECTALAAAVDSECVRHGLAGEDRSFQPHLTLARAREREGAEAANLPAPPRLEAWRAGELVLYESRASRAGAVYEPLATVPLR